MRDLPLTNHKLLVNHTLEGNVRDIFYPNVGKENHSQQQEGTTYFKSSRDQSIKRLGQENFQTELDYEESTMVGSISIRDDIPQSSYPSICRH